ncbi:helix-turn-helix domain-containing protein [Chitinophaga caseinilytica]|uniref:helix-turn-helix domain-containing protein n=1 Tax=Chitinophaga caseinilytica TaxID=2267521 RepID=UPI003C2FFF9B
MDIEKLIASGVIKNELEYQRAMVANRKLRLLAESSAHFKNLRSKLLELLEKYEKIVWSDADTVSVAQVDQSDLAAAIAEKERIFFEKRKKTIQRKLKEFNLTQEELGLILGHKSKTHMSELINGVKPFTLTDIVVISKIFKLEIDLLIPKYLTYDKIDRINTAIDVINKPKLNTAKRELALC